VKQPIFVTLVKVSKRYEAHPFSVHEEMAMSREMIVSES